MRLLMIVGAIVVAMMVPWSSINFPWPTPEPDRDLSLLTPSVSFGPMAILIPELGIMPVDDDSDDPPGALAAPANSDAPSIVLASFEGNVKCENGVCRIVPGHLADSVLQTAELGSRSHGALEPPPLIDAASEPQWTWEEARVRLRELGVARYRLETLADTGQFRFSCSIPLGGDTGTVKRFEAAETDDLIAVAAVLAQIENWQKARR